MTPDPPAAIFVRFLKFGALAWGGPAAQIAMIKRECVDEEGWVDEETFKRTLAVYQVLPGPEAHELCVYFGRIRGGKLGGILAGLGFMLPGFLLDAALSVLYVEADLAEHLDELFYGLKAAVGALLARALVRLSRSFITDVPLAAARRRRLRTHVVRVGRASSSCCSAPGSPTSSGRTPRADCARPHSFTLGLPAVLAALAGAVTLCAHGRDLLGGPEGRAGHLRRRLHRDPLPSGRRGREQALAHREPSSSTGWPWAASCPRR